MPLLLAARSVMVLTRVAGTLQKHLFEKLPQTISIRKAFRKVRGQDPNFDAWADAVVRSWDIAIGWAYDDPVDLIADVAGLGVNISSVLKGVGIAGRIGRVVGTQTAIRGTEFFVDLIGALTDVTDPNEIIEGLQGAVDDLTDAADPVVDAGIKVAFHIAEVTGDVVSFIANPGFQTTVELSKSIDAMIKGFLSFIGVFREAIPPPGPPPPPLVGRADIGLFGIPGVEPPTPDVPPPRPPRIEGLIGELEISTITGLKRVREEIEKDGIEIEKPPITGIVGVPIPVDVQDPEQIETGLLRGSFVGLTDFRRIIDALRRGAPPRKL